jgi:hypothetical protein
VTTVPGRGLGASIVSAALVLSVVVGGLPLVGFLRDGIHLYCDYSDVGESAPGSFFCADGIGYIIPVVTTFFVWTLVSAAGIVAMSGWIPPALRPRLLGILALAPIGYLSWIAAGATGRLRATAQPRDFWAEPMLAATVFFALFAAVVLALLAVPRSSARIALYVAGSALLLAALVAQPGMVSAVIVSAGVFGASFVLDRARFEATTARLLSENPGSTGPSRRAVP